MSRVLIIQNSCSWPRTKNSRFAAERKVVPEGRIKIGLMAAGLVLLASAAVAGIFYVYQVNSIATKGMEIREIENKIHEVEKEGNELKIKEVELKSMYNIEKATENLNLIAPESVSYIDMAGPMAMK